MGLSAVGWGKLSPGEGGSGDGGGGGAGFDCGGTANVARAVR